MSRLTDLLHQVQQRDPQLGADLAAEIKILSQRRSFGLNFERHMPETVELPGRPVRVADKVRVLPARGARSGKFDRRLWRVARIRSGEHGRVADLVALVSAEGTEPETAQQSLAELVVVAEFRDPIYPGLRSTGGVTQGGAKPFHVVINGENFHALQTLLYTHEGQVDAIYIDPPYNTRDKDWKYNNDYVDSDDLYVHSKWLAFIERRLRLARLLLNPADSTLIVTIDEKEYLRLGLLLEQTFPEARIQMVTSVMSAKGAVRPGRFSRVEEYLFYVTFGKAQILPQASNMLESEQVKKTKSGDIEWLGLRRREPSSIRGSRPNQFFPIFVDAETGRLHSVGAAIDDHVDRHDVPTPDGTVALWPLKPNGAEMLWGLTPGALRSIWAEGYARVDSWNPGKATGTVKYLPSGTIALIRAEGIEITGRAADGSVQGRFLSPDQTTPPKKVWNVAAHNAENGGTKTLSALIPGRRFDYPKSLYAVEDALRFVVANKPDATILDFFAGSGTTAHAVMRLNRQDGGHRKAIVVTNNEVSANEEAALRDAGHRPGEPEWEALGICDHVTKPRLKAAVTGTTADGTPVAGEYDVRDEFLMSEGFDENVEFFDLTYEAPRAVGHHRSFSAVAPLLWLKAGATGGRIDAATESFAVADTYGVLFNLDASADFLSAVAEAKSVRMAFIVTDDDRSFQMVCAELPSRVEPIRLYSSYLTNFIVNAGRE